MFLRLYCDVERKQTQAGEEPSQPKTTQTQKPQTNRQTLLGLPAGPVLTTSPANAGGQAQSLFRELTSHMPCTPKKTENRNNTVTNSTQTLKGPTSKNPKLKNVF